VQVEEKVPGKKGEGSLKDHGDKEETMRRTSFSGNTRECPYSSAHKRAEAEKPTWTENLSVMQGRERRIKATVPEKVPNEGKTL